MSDDGGSRGRDELVLGLVGAALGGLLIQQTALLPVGASYARISPRLIPFAVGIGLVALGLAMALRGLAGRHRGALAPAVFERTDWLSLAVALVALLVHRQILEAVGFVPAATLLFVAMAWALGSRALARDVLCGLALAVSVWLALGKGLALQLPMGPLQGLL